LTKIFCDIADLGLIKKFNKKKLVKGFTTNPSLMRKAGAKDYSKYSKKILKITNKPVSCEVFADDINEMYDQAKKINNLAKNIYVKIPITNTKGESTNELVNKLLNENIKVNLTAIFLFDQCANLLKNYQTIYSHLS